MSQIRPIWNDGQGLATPDLQRPCDVAGAADDRVLEILNTPGSVQKRILPLLEETASINPRLLAIPAAATPGAVSLQPCELIAGAPSASQQVSLAATLYAAITSATVAGNTSGSTRYDLIYATVQRSVSVTGTRKIKSATDGTLSSQTINLADAPAVTLGVNSGFLTGATAPTLAQINAAVPADTAPSSSTFGAFNFPVAYVTVANGYVAGTALSQDSSGTTFITQCWTGGHVRRNRIELYRPGTLVGSGANEDTKSVGVTTRNGAGLRLLTPLWLLPSTKTDGTDQLNTWTALDNSVDWRRRMITGTLYYLNSANLYGGTPEGMMATLTASYSTVNAGTAALFTGTGVSLTASAPTPSLSLTYFSGADGLILAVGTDGVLRFAKTAIHDNTNGDLLIVDLTATDQMLLSA